MKCFDILPNIFWTTSIKFIISTQIMLLLTTGESFSNFSLTLNLDTLKGIKEILIREFLLELQSYSFMGSASSWIIYRMKKRSKLGIS